MPKLLGSAPVLLVKDVVASANYFRDAIGFRYDEFYGEPPCFCICERDGLRLMLAKADNPADIKPYWQLRENTWNAYRSSFSAAFATFRSPRDAPSRASRSADVTSSSFFACTPTARS